MENINFKIKQIELTIDSILENVPVGIAYLVLKNKTAEIEELFNAQAYKEAQQIQQQEKASGEQVQ